MAGYIRQSSFVDGDTITAALFNNEYNQLLNAFNNATGHAHDGTTAEGPVIGLIGDAGETAPNNKVLIDTTNNFVEFYVQVSSAPVQQLYIADGAIIPVTDSDIDLGTSSLYFKNAYIDSITTTGNIDVGGNLTVTGTTTFNGGTITMGDAATDNVVFGADIDSNIIPDDDNTYDLGSTSQEWRNLYIDGTANIDSLVADTADINGGTIDGSIIGGTTAAAITGTAITGTSFVIGSADISEAELETIDGVTAGTVAASKAIVVDANKDITGGRNITITGEIDAATLDISGNADIDGTLEADAITINGVTLSETIADTVGAMVSSNTETGIAVSYDDADNTLDFVIGDDAIVQSMIADDAIDSQHYVDGSIDLVHLSANSVDSDQYVDGSIDLVHMSANSVDSDQYVDGSIDLIHMSANSVDSDQYVDGSIDTVHLADDAVTGAKLANNIDIAGTLDVTGILTADSNVVIAGDLTVNGTTTTLNTATLDVEDKNITINYGAGDTSGSANGAGITIQDAVDASNDATILWDTTNDEFDFSHAINVAGNIAVSGTVDGRDVATDGTKLDGIESSATADQTAAEIRTAVEAATDSNVFTDADHTKLNAIEALADVTDATNVTAAGALMDSELTAIASVKALNQGVATTDSPTFVNVTGTSLDISGDIDVDGTTNLDVVDIDGAVDMATTLAVAGNVDFNGDLDVDGTTNLDVVDIDGAVDMASTLTVAGDANFDSNTLFVDVSANNVGIGTASPARKLDVNGSGIVRGFMTLYGTGTDNALFLHNTAYEWAAYTNASNYFVIEDWNLNQKRLVIDTSGNVGIGTVTPGSFDAEANNLVVGSGSGDEGITIFTGSSVGDYGSIFFGDATGTPKQGQIRYEQNNEVMSFYTNTSEKMRIDLNGNVGIGDTSPVAPLTIKGRGTFSINNTDFTMGNNLYYDSVSDRWERLTASAGAAVYLTGGMLQFYNTTAGGATGDLVTATQRFQINSSGRQAYNGSATANGHGNFVGEVGTGYKALMFEHTVGGGEVGKIVTTASTVALSSTSDYRLKENVDYTWDATTRLKQLKPCRFNWIIDETNTLSDGFLAHEVSSIIPEAVSGEKDAMQDKEYEVTPAVLDDDGNVVTEAVMGTRSLPDYQGIDQSKLVPLLTKALQEQQTLIESLTTRLETLENA
jgi:cytoskeletal protein CcmA (bactofilin family)